MKLKDITLYEDSDVLVINKPSGLMVHSDGRTKEKTLADFLVDQYPKMKDVGEPWLAPEETLPESATSFYSRILGLFKKQLEIKNFIYRPGIVHRLDKETSGVMVIAKNQKAFEFLKQQFQNREVKKKYIAVVWGWIKNDEGVIDKSIGRSGKDFRQWSAGRGARGTMREAVTEYKVLKRFESDGEKFSIVELTPKTGRTHQLRVHMKYLNHPIICDYLYTSNHPCVLGFNRVALHAKSISFTLPSDKYLSIEAPLPEEFKLIL
ncbi:MAG: RluA family pseudouridine synthase [Candidatus Paceibacterota bacterium]|jgi:23S rRNA pseudouridine1911/1915/1917 synthase